MRILWVDDEAHLMAVFGRRLRDLGAEVDIARSVYEAKGFLASASYSLVVLDLHLPYGGAHTDSPAEHGFYNGLQILDCLRNTVGPDVPVIVHSAVLDANALEDVGNYGNVRLVAKPVPLDRMLSLVRESLSLENGQGESDQ